MTNKIEKKSTVTNVYFFKKTTNIGKQKWKPQQNK